MPKSALTGTQKKAQKRDIKFAQQIQKMFLKEHEAEKPFKASSKQILQDIAKGKHAPETSLSQLMKDYARAGRGAEKFFEPIKEERIAEFKQQAVPQIFGQYGREAGAGSSALNQALAASAANLQRQLASDISGMQMGLAQNLIGQREASRLQGLEARLRAAGAGIGQQITPQSGMTGLAGMNPYLQKSGQTSGMGGALIGGGLGALGSYLGSEAGSAALTAGLGAMFSSRSIKENIQDYDKGIEEIRKLKVKKYDYTIPVQGRQTNRVGLIAEDVPEEIQDTLHGINAVDLYGLMSILVNAVKDLDAKVAKLEANHV